MLDDEGRAAYRVAVERIEADWKKEFESGQLTPLGYYRRIAGLPLDHLAHYSGILESELELMDSGERAPTAGEAARLAPILGVDSSQLT